MPEETQNVLDENQTATCGGYVGLDAARALTRFNEAIFAEIQAFERATALSVDAIKLKREDNELSSVKTTVS